jgi:hypothetical protein
MSTKPAANVETIAARDHNVEKEKGRRLALCVGNEICWCEE